MKFYVFEWTMGDALAAFSRVAERPYSLLLDSADAAHPQSRYSYALYDPAEIFESADFDALKALYQNHKCAALPPACPVPFCGGLAGLVEYEGAIKMGLYNKFVATDHERGQSWFLCWAETEEAARAQYDELQNHPAPAHHYTPQNLEWHSNFTRENFEAAIETVRDYIAAGDIFQANIAQRFTADAPAGHDPFAHYLHLRRVNAAPFAAYMNMGDTHLASASPERFVSCNAAGHVMTQPIKGTAVRSDDAAQDRANAAALEGSEKDRAENIMIVDLLRNDLSRVCTPESVEVSKLCALESFARVHHLVSTIEGDLAAGQTPIDLLAACFPGGSITGAPKIRAMEIITEIETIRRGAYCGALAVIGFDGFMDSNILIRTITHKDDEISFQAGGGITYASDAAREYEETLDKAAAIFESFAVTTKERAA